jgi:N-dimethylarginine dimethylaminohydrolase
MAGRFTPGPKPNLEAAIERALEQIGARVLDVSNEDVPVETGRLLRSGKYKVEGSRVGIGYSDPKAVAAHENMQDHLDNGKSAKFLERALNSVRPSMARIAAAELRRVFR